MKRLLLVDDDIMNCVMAKHALSQNYEVFTANSGTEALDFLNSSPVDLILMDIEMPEMNGKEVASKIKEHEEWSKIPIIFLTANSTPETEVEYLSWGADDFIAKPFVPLVMNTRISRILEIYDLRRNLEQQLENRTRQMERATLKSQTDALTKLHNRDYLVASLSDYLAKDGTGTLFMIDLDNFKSINDTFGHIVGDKVLQCFADVLKGHAREGDLVCRLAGDEFVTFYPKLEERDTAAKKAEDIIKSFAKQMSSMGYGGIVSVSIGITIATPGSEFKTLYNNADSALYFVKNNGKNAYHFFSEQAEKLEEVSVIADLDYVNNMIEQGLTDKKGAFNVAYDEFKYIYDFVSRCVARKKQQVQIVLFTMNILKKQAGPTMDDLMALWESSLIASLRFVDTGTQYSNCQYMMIFMDVDYENGKMVAERAISKFFETNEYLRDYLRISYDIRTMQPNTQ